MKRIAITTFALLFTLAVFGQGSDDACLFSQTYYQGTAKALGMGNALGAVGGDMTSVCINPAGLGIYRSSEFTTTVNLLDNHARSTYYGTSNGANQMRLSIPNVGYVSTKQKSNYRNLRFTQFGIGLTRTNDYNTHAFARGINPTSSKIDDYLAQATSKTPSLTPSIRLGTPILSTSIRINRASIMAAPCLKATSGKVRKASSKGVPKNGLS